MKFELYQLDAFSAELFKGNPAAVVPLKAWISDELMQAIAAENNLAETAFFVQNNNGDFDLRWFTPTDEVPLCGHATLASAYVLFNELSYSEEEIRFQTKSGELRVKKTGDYLELNFPALTYRKVDAPEAIEQGLSIRPKEILIVDDDPNYFAVYESEQDVVELEPELDRLATLHPHGVVVTAPGNSAGGYDCVSRYFLPSFGIPEDPVTGSIHCVLTPLWSNKLGKNSIVARQASRRGGELKCELSGNDKERVLIKGKCVLYLKGEINCPAMTD